MPRLTRSIAFGGALTAALLISLTMYATSALGGEPTADEIVRKAAAQAKTTNSTHALVTLTSTDTKLAGPVVVEVWGERPGKGRAEVRQAPLTELNGIVAVSDGTRGWFYDKSKNRVITGSKDDLKQANMPAHEALNWDQAVDKLFENANVKLLGSEKVDGVDAFKLELTAKPGTPAAEKASGPTTVWIEKARFVPIKAAVTTDKGGATVSAKNVEINPKLDAALFTFTPPAGTEIVPASSLKPQTLSTEQAKAAPGVLSPSYLPVGAVKGETTKIGATVVQHYTLGKGELLVSSMKSESAPAPVGRDQEKVTVRGQSGSVVQRDGQTILSWRENGYTYVIAGPISPDEARKVAEGLK